MIVLFNTGYLFFFYHVVNNSAEKIIEPLSSYFVIAILTGLIIISLFLTFYNKGNSIHKVLGLLLLSIFVVFLWIIQTQFLFIYLVYILAFISAVLMLFLSVILMLPISSILLNRNIKSSYWLNLLFIDDSFVIYISLFILGLFIWYLSTLINNKFLLFRNLLNYLKLFWWNLRNRNEQVFYSEEMRHSYLLIKKNKLFSSLLFTVNTQLNNYNFLVILKTNYYFNLIRKLFIIFVYLFLDVLRFIFVYCPINIYIYVKNILSYSTIRLTWLDNLFQLYIFINILGIACLTYDARTINYIDFINETSDEKMLGLAVLKNLLYNQAGSFLIISTLVLLIALIGAAIMTKKH